MPYLAGVVETEIRIECSHDDVTVKINNGLKNKSHP